MSNRCQCQPATRRARDTTARHQDSESIPASSLVASDRSSLSFAYTKSISRFKARQADGTSGQTPSDTKARASQAPLGDGTTDGGGVAVGVGAGGVGAAVGVRAGGVGAAVGVGVRVGGVGTSIGASIGTCASPTWPLASRHRPHMGSHRRQNRRWRCSRRADTPAVGGAHGGADGHGHGDETTRK